MTIIDVTHSLDTLEAAIRETESLALAADILIMKKVDYVWNDTSKKVTHIVPSVDAFDDGEKAATICGDLAAGADLLANYDLCPLCVSGFADL